MDREIVLLVLCLLVCGPMFFMGGLVRPVPPRARNAQHLERLRWSQLWLTVIPAAVGVAAIGGWVLVEPEDAEAVPWPLIAVSLPFLFIWLRAASRAVRALAFMPEVKAAATVGFLFPRVVISPEFRRSVDEAALSAAVGHELAHARHRDPIRLWLAQLSADLMWPAPPAQSRLRAWRRSLELARDEEARREGADGADLAAAVIAALRVSGGRSSAGAATLTGDAAAVRQRVRRLLRPLPPAEQPPRSQLGWLAPATLIALTAGALGVTYGEAVVRLLFGRGS